MKLDTKVGISQNGSFTEIAKILLDEYKAPTSISECKVFDL